jgi:hypothetical protein
MPILFGKLGKDEHARRGLLPISTKFGRFVTFHTERSESNSQFPAECLARVSVRETQFPARSSWTSNE